MKHFVIPDTQVRAGVNTDHLEAAGNYIAEHADPGDKIIHLGDHWDMPSLQGYDKPGQTHWEDRDFHEDIESGNAAMERFMKPLRRRKLKKYFTIGNHEQRIERAAQDPLMRRFKSYLNYKGFNLDGWKVRPFLKPTSLDGVLYAHYFISPSSLYTNPIGGTVENKLRHIKCSFTMGHQQTFQVGTAYTGEGRRIRGLVCGRFYSHDEDYLGPQKNAQSWSGILVKHEVKKGDYDLMEVSMDYLLRKWI